MAKTAQTKTSSPGICNFCQGEFDKTRMTQHLKSCKQRAAMIRQTNAGSEQKERIFHLLVEGKYLPMYWMHLEMPATATLEDLDNFLRGIWLECCDHLSGFKIGKISFSSPPPDFAFVEVLSNGETGTVTSVEEEKEWQDEEEDEEDEEEDNGLTLEEEIAMLTNRAKEVEEYISSQFPQGLAYASVEDIAACVHQKLLQDGKVSPDDLEKPELHDQIMSMASQLKYGMFVSLVEAPFREQDMDYKLRKVLKVGTKFSYIYDFGSSTYLSLKVLAEREGAMTNVNEDNDQIIQILSRNEPPVIPCRKCGKPATRVVPGYDSVDFGALCDTCGLKRDEKDFIDEESLLPIVNSPRVGVCAYTGGEDTWEDEEEWDEDDYEEDEE